MSVHDGSGSANSPSARMEIHISGPMQSSAEVANQPTSHIAALAGPESSCLPKEELVTLRYVASGGRTLPGAHWELIDRTTPRFDPLKGLRGRRPQKGSMPKVLTLTNGSASDNRAGSVEEIQSTVNDPSSENDTPRGDFNDELSTPMTDNSRDAPSSHSKTRKRTISVMEDGDRSTSAADVAEAPSSAHSQTSGDLQPSKSARHTMRGRSPPKNLASKAPSGTPATPRTKRRSQRIQDTVSSPVRTRTSDAHTSKDLGPTFPSITNEDDAVPESRDIEFNDPNDEKSSSDSEAASESASLSDCSTQAPKSSVSSAAPLFGRRADRLAKIAARKATLAKFGIDGPVSVSAEAYRIAQQREDPDFNKDKAVATAISNRGRGLRPRKWPPAPVFEDEDDEENNEEEEEDDDERNSHKGSKPRGRDSTELEDESNDDNDNDYDDNNDDGSYNTHHPLRPSSNRKRKAKNESGAEFSPNKKARTSTPVTTKTRRKSTSTQDALVSQPVRVEDSITEAASSSASPPAPAVKAVQPKMRPGRKSISKAPRPFSCDVCGQSFNRQEHVKRHMQSVHSGEKPFSCDTCGKRFARRDNLTQHTGSHVKVQYEAAHAGGYPMPTTTYNNFSVGNGLGLLSGLQAGQEVPSETASTQQQLRIAENHRRLEDQGKL